MSEKPEQQQGRELPEFPVDDFTLDQLEHALNTCVEVADDGSHGPHTYYDPEDDGNIPHCEGYLLR